MPINTLTYKIIRDMNTAGILPRHPHIPELGESNWYGDIPIEQLERDINELAGKPEIREELIKAYLSCKEKLSSDPPRYEALWELSHIFYKVFLNYASYTAIDLGGSDNALKLDLNHPVELDRKYDMVIDFGTAEHVFNVFQLFKTVHELTKPGGFIIHGLPFHGWVDHGFYNFQPTFYLDLAATNNYQVRLLLYWKDKVNQAIPLQSREQISQLFNNDELSGSGTLFVTFQKSSQETDFKIPMQGYYAGTVSETVHSAWHNNR